jgi:hypothetical protein
MHMLLFQLLTCRLPSYSLKNVVNKLSEILTQTIGLDLHQGVST